MKEPFQRSESPPTDSPASEPPAEATEILAQLVKLAHEFSAYLHYYLVAQRDRLWAHGWQLGARAVLGLAGALAMGGLFITAGWFFLTGLAGGLGEWTGSTWLGQLLAGLLVWVGIIIVTWIGWSKWKWRRLDQIRRKYEQRQS